MLASFRKGCTFAPAKQSNKSSFSGWSGSSAWLECLPVTQEVASSSLVRTAQMSNPQGCFFYTQKSPAVFSDSPDFWRKKKQRNDIL